MGFFKKIFKPVSKVLDKIIPNEIKPALPYLAAFAPYFGPTSSLLGKGIMQRALLSGGLNIGAQLSQEGNEGDINLLSAGLGALSGAMTAPGAADSFAGSRIVGTGADGKAVTASEYAKLSEGANLGSTITTAAEPIAGLADPGFATETFKAIQGPVPFSQVVPGGEAGLTGLAKAKNLALKGLEGGSKFISEGMAGGLKDKAQVLAIPAATATGDLMQAEARQLEKQAAIDAALAEAEGLADAGLRGDAIRNAMRAYGFFTDDEIESTVSSAGYKAGGRVGFSFGGIDEAIEGVSKDIQEEGKKGIMMAAKDDPMLVEEYNKYVFDLMEQRPNAKPMSFQDFKRMIMSGMKDGGIMNAKRGLVDEPGGYAGEYITKKPKNWITKKKKFDLSDLESLTDDDEDEDNDGIEWIKRKDSSGSNKWIQKKAEGGLMNLGGKEMDMRGGGFIPIGKKERADDVPARLSKNEFVMTADAVRAAGGGSVNKGAKRMYNLMNNLEAKS